jgi:trimeric autotransporter adhesin
LCTTFARKILSRHERIVEFGPKLLSFVYSRSPNKLTVTAMFKSAFRRPSPLALLPLSLLLSGCTMQQNSSAPIIPALKHGLVHGGQQPVTNATIQLYAVGASGDGSAATPLLSPAPVTDANGTFNISGTYSCPSSSSLVYIVATGGNPGMGPGTNNTALSLMAALGPCGNLATSTFIVIDELTTVAAVYPLAPYMTSPSAVGSASGDATALANAFTLASEFVNTATGTSPGTGVPVGTYVPVAQINTIGDILASCINSAGGVAGDTTACGTLFSLTTPTGTTPATETITALLHLANDPTLNTAALYDLVPPSAPFQPSQPQTPPDLSVRLTVPSGFTASTAELDFPAARTSYNPSPVTQSVTFTNNTVASVGISIASTPSGADPNDFRIAQNIQLCPIPVLPGATCTIGIEFTPTATGLRTAYLVVTNTSANPVISILMTGVGLESGGGQVYLSPTLLNFTAPGTPMNTVLTNASSTLSATIDGISISNDPTTGQPAFTQTNTCGPSLAPLATCTISATALSETQAYSTSVLTVASDSNYGPQTGSLSYSNGFTGSVLINFGSRSIGTQGSGGYNFEPPGFPSGPVTFTLTGPDATDFSFLSGSSSQTTSCTVSRFSPFCGGVLYFNPSALGLRTATLNINGTPAYGVIGVGLTAGLHFSVTPASVDLGSVQISQTSSTATALSIVNVGTVPITFNAPSFSGSNPLEFAAVSTCATLAPNATCGMNVTASPTQPTNRFATLNVTESTATMQQAVPLRVVGLNPGPVVNPSSFAFGYTLLGTTSPAQSFTVTALNNDAITAQTVSSNATLAPSFAVTQGSSCPSTPCPVSVVFAPTVTNTSPNDLYSSSGEVVFSDLFSSQTTMVSLTGLHDLASPPPPTTTSVSPGSLTFTPQTVGTISSGQTLTISNTGTQTLDLAVLITGANPGDYVVSNPCTQVAAPGQGFSSCTFYVQFQPTATGTRTGNVQIVANNIFSPTLISLTGTGQ